MQFKGLCVSLDASDTTTLVSADVDTGLSLRGGIAWLVHAIDVAWMDAVEAVAVVYSVALSTLKGQAVIPDLLAPGCVYRWNLQSTMLTSGRSDIHLQRREVFGPPVPLATPNLTIYASTQVDVAAARGDEIQIRIGYTTIPLEPAIFQEIAEVWGW